MRSGGSNLTPQHMEDLSLCGLFLMEVAKKVDREFGALQTSSHTTHDAYKDITKLLNYLTEKKVGEQIKERNSPIFLDPTDVGLNKMCNSTWIRDTLDRADTEDLEREVSEDHGTIDMNYELCDVV